jgi:hypothetical protein
MTAGQILEKMLEKYKDLFQAVQKIRANSSYNQSHGLDHDLFVAQYGFLIADDERIGELAWVAGILHSLDRLTDDAGIFYILFMYLPDSITSEERRLIVDALCDHSKLNHPDDNPVTVVLKDADRIANIGPLDLIRLGQQRHDILPIIIGYCDEPSPGSTFKNHGCAWDAIHYNCEWRKMLRCKKAIEMSKPLFDFFEFCITLQTNQLRELGLDTPLPV